MFKKFTNGCVRVVNRWLPDPFLFAIILSIVVYVAAMLGTQQGPVAMIKAWGNTSGFWNLLAFSMQMALVLVLGSAMASAKVFKRFLGAIASTAKNKKSAILITTFVSVICCWLNWGFGLIAGALLARKSPAVSAMWTTVCSSPRPIPASSSGTPVCRALSR